MMLGGMPTVTSATCVQRWGQKATPLVTLVFPIADAQADKSRLFSVLDGWFDWVDVSSLSTSAIFSENHALVDALHGDVDELVPAVGDSQKL